MAITGGSSTGNSILNTLKSSGVSESKAPTEENRQVSLFEMEVVVFDGGDKRSESRTVAVRLGNLDNPPNGKGSLRKLADKIKGFFAAMKDGIVSGFSRIGKSISARRELSTQSRIIHDKILSKKNDVQAIDKQYLPSALCRALRTGDVEQVAKVLAKGGKGIERTTLLDSGNNLITDNKIKAEKELASFSGSIDFMLTGGDIDRLKEQEPILRQRLEGNESALAVLDRFVNHYDFEALTESSFESQVNGFRIIDRAKTSSERNTLSMQLVSEAFRGSSFFSYAMHSASAENAKELGKSLVQVLGDVTKNDKSLRQASKGDLTLTNISGENAPVFMKGVNKLVETLTNPENVRKDFGTQMIDTLRGYCQKIADAPGISSDTKNQMIDKLFIDQVFLRGGISALIAQATSNKETLGLMIAFARTAQQLFNGVDSSDHPPNENIRSSLDEAKVNTRLAIDNLKTVLEIPSVAPSDTDWVEK